MPIDATGACRHFCLIGHPAGQAIIIRQAVVAPAVILQQAGKSRRCHSARRRHEIRRLPGNGIGQQAGIVTHGMGNGQLICRCR